jgi:hypothetical protein
MRAKPNREISAAEAACLRAALEHASVIPEATGLIGTISALRVVGRCDCGCASVDLVKDSTEQNKPIADGTGKTARGGDVGLIVWGTNQAITGLEIYDLGAGDDDLNLPELESIAFFDHTVA